MVLFSCQNTDEKLITEYYAGLNQSDFNKVKKVLADTFTVIEGDWIVKYSNNEYYDWFAWDSVFKPDYKIKDFELTDSGMIYTVSKLCKRINFLHGDKLDFKIRATIENNKISSLSTERYLNMDFDKWGKNRESLIAWVDKEQPDLSGFMNKQNSDYAMKYLKAMQLYSNSEIKNENEQKEIVDNIELLFPYDTLDNWLTLNISENVILSKLGKPDSVGKDTYWGALGTYVQEWKYLDHGISVEMESDTIGQEKNVLMISVFEPCKMKTSNNIGISSSRENIVQAYSDCINKDFSDDNQIVVGSIYGGVIFKLVEDKVIDIFIGAAAE
jgi:hypothetical protein